MRLIVGDDALRLCLKASFMCVSTLLYLCCLTLIRQVKQIISDIDMIAPLASGKDTPPPNEGVRAGKKEALYRKLWVCDEFF